MSDWPMELPKGAPLTAWAPPGISPALAAVAVSPEDVEKGLRPSAYRHRLVQRVIWMCQQEPSPGQAAASLARELEAVGVWQGSLPEGDEITAVRAMLADNPLWPDYLGNQVQLPDQRPFPVKPFPAALQAVRQTSLAEWMALAIPAET